MIPVKEGCFACDECPLVQELEYRQAIAEEHPEWGELQYDHCGCEKVSDEFFTCGYCEDAWERQEQPKPARNRKSGSAYRREMARRKFLQKKRAAELAGADWTMQLGYNRAGLQMPIWRHHDESELEATYIKRNSNSRNQKFWKRYANKLVRKGGMDMAMRGSSHKKMFDYSWKMY